MVINLISFGIYCIALIQIGLDVSNSFLGSLDALFDALDSISSVFSLSLLENPRYDAHPAINRNEMILPPRKPVDVLDTDTCISVKA